MAASKLILFGTSFIRIQRNSSATPSSSSSSSSSISNLLHSYPHFNKSSSCSPRLHLFTNSYCSATASVDELTETGSNESNESISVSHPWPEWVGFINKLKSKGYFDDSSFKAEDDDGGGGGDENFSYNDLNRLKHACLSFARERFDLCKSLSRDDIQTVVKYGCPSLTRKAVNSAKKLRAYVRLDEGDVCSGCTLRGSCDRAYVILNDTEAAARTVDIVRILMIYAIDPLVHSGEKPHGRDHIETSARKLLAELIDLSDTTIDPALPKPAVRAATSQKPENVDRERPQNIEMKRGDWMCSNCNFMNFARNIRCLECKTDGPKRVSVNDVEMKKGDWNCPQCQFMNFARNKNCLRCQESRPQRELNPGEWECPKCDFLNYRRNTSCLKCNCDRPKDDAADYEEQMWKRPS